jgi:hypothetical protein
MTLFRSIPTVVVLFLGASFSFAKAEDAKLTAARKQAQECGEATVKGDYKKLVEMTHPSAVKSVGGKEKMIDLLEKSMAELKSKGFAFTSFKADPVQSSATKGGSLYCILPSTLKIKIDQRNITQRSYLLGISSDGGKTWKFLEGAQGEPGLRKLMPEIPKDLKFPEPIKHTSEDDDEKDKPKPSTDK